MRQVDTATLHSAGTSGLGRKNQRRHPAEAAVRGPLGVVGLKPGVGDLPHLVEVIEEVGVEDPFAMAAIEALVEAF